jgi:hypothetical protein
MKTESSKKAGAGQGEDGSLYLVENSLWLLVE